MGIIVNRIFLLSVSLIYLVAFKVALDQSEGLLSSKGLTPISKYIERLSKFCFQQNKEYHKVEDQPTIFMYIEPTDNNLNFILQLGVTISFITIFCPNFLLYFALWGLYQSIVNIGQTWYSFGWESQMLELGFLAIWTSSYKKKIRDYSITVKLANIFLIFRIMLGAGLIKIRGDECWRNLTCMNYHYETQPVPNPLSWYMHKTSNEFHGLEVLINHFVELIAPFMLLLPIRKMRIYGGLIQIGFQLLIIVSGNLSFLNWLTIIPCIFCFDDECFPNCIKNNKPIKKSLFWKIFKLIKELTLAGILIYFSINPVMNLFSSQQIMNTSYDKYKIVNTYGAFGSVGKQRTEIVIFGSHNPDGPWEEYYFKCKPGPINRRPCVISPYHYRLDWLAWFAGFQNINYQPWTINFMYKMMDNDPYIEKLIDYNPFKGRQPPKFMKIDQYLYKYGQNDWWERQYIGPWCRVVTREQLYPIIQQLGWI